MVLTPPSNGSNYMAINESGDKMYELSNHVGSVIMVISDRKLPVESSTNPGTVDHYLADVISAIDYFPFGSPMPGRTFNSTATRHGFGGMEQDPEIYGDGNSYDFGARMYNPRLGRWFSRDYYEFKRPDLTPYRGMGNNPIYYRDQDGDFELPPDQAKLYPLTNHFLKKFGEYYQKSMRGEEIPKDFVNAFPPEMQSAFMEMTTYSADEIVRQFTYVNDPEGTVTDNVLNPTVYLDENLDYMEDGQLRVQSGMAFNTALKIDNNVAADFEKALREINYGAGETVEYLQDRASNITRDEGNFTPKQRSTAIQAFVSTFGHEMVHFGRLFKGLPLNSEPFPVKNMEKIEDNKLIPNNGGATSSDEPGQIYEQKTYGERTLRVIPKGGKVETN